MVKKIIFLFMIIIVCFAACYREKPNNLKEQETYIEQETEEQSNNDYYVNEPDDTLIKPKQVELFYMDYENWRLTHKVAETDGSPEHIVSLLVSERILPEGVALLRFSINGRSGQADMNSVFGDAMRSTGTAGEAELMNALVNTLLVFFDLDEILITEEGEVLVTGHAIINGPSRRWFIFPSDFIGVWKREEYDNILNISFNTIIISSRIHTWYLLGKSGEKFILKRDGVDQFELTIQYNNDKLVIDGDTGSGQENWNGTWLRQ